jgi:hypothetical protein
VSETAISKAITDALTAKGCIVTRVQSGVLKAINHYGKIHFVHCARKGTPDLHVMAAHGISFWLEAKRRGKKASKEQLIWHAKARRLGHSVFTLVSVKEALAVHQSLIAAHRAKVAA